MGSSMGYSSMSMDSRFGGGQPEMKTRPDNSTVLVKNLPYSLDWQTLKKHFQKVGDIRFAEIKMDGGKSAGWGLICFRKEEDAQRAINLMHRSKLEGREVIVRMYTGAN